MHMRFSASRFILSFFLCWLFIPYLADDPSAYALQQAIPDSLRKAMRKNARDTTRSDTVQTPGRMQQRTAQSGTGDQKPTGGTITFQATDSLVFTFKEDRKARLYGSAQVSHAAGKLTAGKIILNLDEHVVRAQTRHPDDTLSQPVLQRKDRKIRSNKIAFNYKTEKGRFSVARVSIQQGKLTGRKVKKSEGNVVYVKDGIYSTCKLDHPHYYIKAERMKVVDRDEIFFTNARLYIFDIPYPAVFPFGYVPTKIKRRQSGILQPTYAFQDQSSRGIGLQNLGWFQYFNDYLTGRFEFNIYTSGTFLGDLKFQYAKRNDFSGNIAIGYSRERGLEETDPNFSIRTNKKLSITHNQDFSPYARISADINLRTADYYQRNSYRIDERAQTSTTSRISYNYRDPSGNYDLSFTASQSQDFASNTATFSAPNATFTVNRFSPFSGPQAPGAETRWYENISVRYSNNLRSDFNYQPQRGDSARYNWVQALLDPAKYRRATNDNQHYRIGLRHDASLSLNNLFESQLYNSSFSLGFTEYWYPSTIRKTFNADSNEVRTHRVREFATARDFNTNFGINTRIYGIWNQNIGSFQSFRHTFSPSLNFNYRPDFSNEIWGYYRTVQVDTSGRTRRYSIFENGVVGGPGRGERRSLNLSLGNTFEAKQVRRDSTGERNENVIRIIDQLDANIGYNFAADSIKLSELDLSFSTNIKDFSIRSNASFNAYARDAEGRKIDQFLISTSDRLAQLTRFSLRISTQFSSEGRSQPVRSEYDFPRHYDPFNQRAFRPVAAGFNSRPISSFDAPWSFSLNFSYSWSYSSFGENRESAVLNLNNIQFRLTPKWRASTSIGYDFINMKLTPSRFSLNRKLHMWDLSFQMNPFGDFPFYLFSLRINNSQLQSLFQKLPILKNLERSSGTLNRGTY